MKKMSAEKIELIYCQNQAEVMRSVLENIALKTVSPVKAKKMAFDCLALIDKQNYENKNPARVGRYESFRLRGNEGRPSDRKRNGVRV